MPEKPIVSLEPKEPSWIKNFAKWCWAVTFGEIAKELAEIDVIKAKEKNSKIKKRKGHGRYSGQED